MILIQSSEATSGASKEKKIDVSNLFGESYGNILKKSGSEERCKTY